MKRFVEHLLQYFGLGCQTVESVHAKGHCIFLEIVFYLKQ